MGSNLGDREANLHTAVRMIKKLDKTELLAESAHYLTAPQGVKDQDWFLNSAVLVKTGLSPEFFLKGLLDIELEMGRTRELKWGPRLIDLDILFWGSAVIDEDNLKVPHPFLADRRFALLPLNDIAPDWRHPELNQTPAEMLTKIPDQGQEAVRQ